MERKTFLKSTLGLGLSAFFLGKVKATDIPQTYLKAEGLMPINGKYSLPDLGYAYTALEPYIDAKTMEIHHTKHHQAYINKLNEALVKEPNLQQKSLEEMLLNLSAQPESVRGVIRNHGGGHWNHSFFWESLKTGTQMGEGFKTLATNSFGSVATMQATFEKIAMGVFGSGWCWLILQNKQLKIITSANQDNPLMDAGKEPVMLPKILLGIDVWEHAYYLKYQNKRAEYISNFWQVVNWDRIENLLKS
jgi:Fe-Mn family superoxide dismutase